MANKKASNGTVSPFPTPAAVPPVLATAPAPAPTPAPVPENPEASFRRFVSSLNGARLVAMCDQSPALKAALGAAWNDFEKQRDAFKAEIAAIKSRALALGIEFDAGKARKPSAPKARPAGAASAPVTVDPAVAAKVLADLQANGASKAVDAMARTGLDAKLWGAAKASLVSEGKLVKAGTRGPQVTYAAAQ